MVYWYGSEEGSSESYSVLPSKNIISYKDGCEKGYNEISPELKKKLELGQHISKYEDQKIRGLELMKSDANVDKQKRKHHWIFKFTEDDILTHWADIILKEQEERIQRSIESQSDKN